MQPNTAAAAICAAFLSFLPSARAQDVAEPESHTVLEPPAAPTPTEEATPAPSPAPRPAARPRGTGGDLGFQLRLGAAETDRFLFGGSFTVGSGPLLFGVSGDLIADIHGRGRHYEDAGDDWGEDDHDWCRVRSGGRCINRVDASFSGFGGLRHFTDPILGGSRIRLEGAAELGWQASYVDERLQDSSGTHWSDASRAYPFVGLRAGAGLTFLGGGHFGVGAFARQSVAGKVCVDTDGGCTRVGGLMAGVYLFGGAEWGVGR